MSRFNIGDTVRIKELVEEDRCTTVLSVGDVGKVVAFTFGDNVICDFSGITNWYMYDRQLELVDEKQKKSGDLRIVYKLVRIEDGKFLSRFMNRATSLAVPLTYEIEHKTKAPSSDAPLFVFDSIHNAYEVDEDNIERGTSLVLRCVGKCVPAPKNSLAIGAPFGTLFCKWVFPIERVEFL